MAKETKSLRKQAEKAERAARKITDVEASESLLALARAFRSQADIMKAKNKADKKRR